MKTANRNYKNSVGRQGINFQASFLSDQSILRKTLQSIPIYDIACKNTDFCFTAESNLFSIFIIF